VTQQPSGSGPDLVGDFQRWLIKSGAREMSRELSGQIAATFGRGGSRRRDVWEHATAPPEHEAPECGWCPLCRAARMVRDNRPGLASQAAATGETLTGLLQDALATVESMLAGQGRRAGAGDPAQQPGARAGWGDAAMADPAGAGPADAGPAGHGPAGHGPAGHGPAGHGAAEDRPGGPGAAREGTAGEDAAGVWEAATSTQDSGEAPGAVRPPE
jgi:hypothetical protein